MGRTLGPYTDVSTARVDGAYEIYEGADEEGRDIEILTLGVSSSKDPSRRALLSDTVAWAHATRGPADAPILKADLNSEQPYVVTMRRTGYRGVERMLERMLAMGPATGPLPITTGATTGQIPRIAHQHSNPHGIPAVPGSPAGSPVTPNSPMAPYLTSANRPRPGWLIPVVIVLSLIVLGGGAFVVVLGMGSSGDVTADGGTQDEEAPPAQDGDVDDSLELPRYQSDLPPVDHFGPGFDADEGSIVQPAGWPFAFRIPQGWECQLGEDDRVVPMLTCKGNESTNDAVPDALHLELVTCPDDCEADERSELERDWNAEPTDRYDDDTLYFESSSAREYELSVSRFFEPQQNTELNPQYVQLVVFGMSSTGESTELRQSINDILTQTQTVD